MINAHATACRTHHASLSARKRLLFCLGLLLSNFAHATCGYLPLAGNATSETIAIAVFKVVERDPEDRFWQVDITRMLSGSKPTANRIRIEQDSGSGFYYQFTLDSEWIGALVQSNQGAYYLFRCSFPVHIRGNRILTPTGFQWLDRQPTGSVTLDQLESTIHAYRQGLSEADDVCRSSSPHCKNSRPVYDAASGELNLPLVQYQHYGLPAYTRAKLKKTGDEPMTFTVIPAQ